MSSLLEVSHLKVLFHTQQGDVPAVDDVSFQVEEGETLCIVGESGCGKSATVQAVMKLVPTPPGGIRGRENSAGGAGPAPPLHEGNDPHPRA